MFYDAVKNDHGLPNDPFKAIVAPRPIGWVSTLSPQGKANLAPYSYFNAFSQSPHYVAFGSGPRKDSMANIEATGEFAFSLATYGLREQINATSAHVDVDEFELAGLTKAPSRIVRPPRVAESPAALECCLHRIVPLPDDDGKAENFLIIGRVLGIHIDDRFIHDGRVDTAAMRPIARLGYSEYATVTEAWRMPRPD
ncbi:MAG: flavin reductase family protein [Aestuariivirga sp.]|uniref:flavin reductase family protein n=1 Tax=Aestuariivirga sp. TaxID=2650926 RepID=UPI0025B9A651|nr:flavin reductase family protein [Aestuariivirga sp.]MCA3560497.1 flavin reductase family protein [Aestuariivirga sp.]